MVVAYALRFINIHRDTGLNITLETATKITEIEQGCTKGGGGIVRAISERIKNDDAIQSEQFILQHAIEIEKLKAIISQLRNDLSAKDHHMSPKASPPTKKVNDVGKGIAPVLHLARLAGTPPTTSCGASKSSNVVAPAPPTT